MKLRRRQQIEDRRLGAGGADPAVVAEILQLVRDRGDAAVLDLTEKFDGVRPDAQWLDRDTLRGVLEETPAAVQADLSRAHDNIEAVARAQRAALRDLEVEVEPGVVIGQRWLPVERVACYVPGGRYPLPSTVLMTVTAARAAGVRSVVVLTPPSASGRPAAVILAAAALAGADGVYVAGGAQAVAAAAWGTATLPAVDLIVGPGNAWVTEAKRQVFGVVGIDALAGPSEVLVLADDTANPERVAADLLAQAEHDPAAIAALVSSSEGLVEQVEAALERQLDTLPTAATARAALQGHGAAVVVADRDALVREANLRAAEHLHLHVARSRELAERCTQYGAIFIGEDSAEVFGDYCAGGNHVLPTGRAARYSAGLSVHTFLRPLASQSLTAAGAASLQGTTARLARLEGLEAHARAAELRR